MNGHSHKNMSSSLKAKANNKVIFHLKQPFTNETMPYFSIKVIYLNW